MFPLEFPYSILSQGAAKGDAVLDPFCGRGTTNYASRILGLFSVGIDNSPVAVASAQAKLANTSPSLIMKTAFRILSEVEEPSEIPQGEFWDWAYHKDTLYTLCRFREGLLQNDTSNSRKALKAIMLGALHGPRPKLKQSYFSNQSPRTYGPKPNYAVAFWKKRDLRPESTDVLKIIAERANRYYANEYTRGEGNVLRGDSRDYRIFTKISKKRKFDWIITSPPYYGMNTYLSDQWLRLWFLGGTAEVDYSKGGQITHKSPEAFASELRQVWKNVRQTSKPGTQLIIRFGGINSRNADPKSILEQSFVRSGWKIGKVVSAGTASKGNRQANHFLNASTRALEEIDVWATPT